MHKSGRAQVMLGLCTFVSRLLGFVRVRVFTYFFGFSSESDVLYAVLAFPNNLRKLFAEGALHSALLPIATGIVDERSRAHSHSQRVFSSVFTVVVIIMIVLVSAGELFAPQLVSILFRFVDEEQVSLAVSVFRIVFPFIAFVSLMTVYSVFLHAHSHFFVSALSPILISISVIIAVPLGASSLGIFSAAWAFCISACLVVVLHGFACMRLGYVFVPMLRGYTQETKTVLKRWVPAILASLAPLINLQFSYFLLTSFDTGQSSYFSSAIVFYQLPIGIIGSAIITVSFVELSRYYARQEMRRLASCNVTAIFKLFALLVPVSIVFFFFAKLGVIVAYGSRRISTEDIRSITEVLKMFSFGIVSTSLYMYFQRSFYAYNKDKWAFGFACAYTGIDICLSLVLSARFPYAWALALAYTISGFIIVPLQFFVISRVCSVRMGSAYFLKLAFANAVLFFLCLAISMAIEIWIPHIRFLQALTFIMVIGLCLGGLYYLMLKLLSLYGLFFHEKSHENYNDKL